jgi:dipeptidyl aminopeptidase/acylaminoacyl peptidase
MGYSFGGYYAPRVAAFDARYAACVAFGALHSDVHAWQAEMRRRAASAPGAIAQSSFQFRWIVGAASDDEALERAKAFSLAGVASRIRCPFLVVHGANDRIVPVAAARELYQAVGSREKTMRIFTAEETGAEHCQVDNRQLGVDFIGDWLLKNM